MKIKRFEVAPVTFSLRHSFRTHLGEKKITQNVSVTLVSANDAQGCGEASSSLAMPEATQEVMMRSLESLRPKLIGFSLEGWKEFCRSLAQDGFHPTPLSALECAFLDLDLRCRGKSLPSFFGPHGEPVATLYTIPALPLPESAAIAREMARRGFKKFKVKVAGEDSPEDLERAFQVFEISGEPLVIDANQGWSAERTLLWLEAARKRGIPLALIEQPLPKGDIAGLRFLKQRSPIPVAADESFRSLGDIRRLVEEDAADVFNLKLAKTGLLEALAISDYLEKAGKKRMIGCMMESAAGLATSVAWAIGSQSFAFVDLDSFLLLEPLDAPSPLRAENGKLYFE